MTTVTPDSRHFTASCVVIDPQRQRVLLVDHVLTGFRQFPGGHLDADETGDVAALREVAEETGVMATLWASHADGVPIPGATRHPAPLMVCEFEAPADDDPAWLEPAHHHLDLLFVATADSSAPVSAQLDEVRAAVWLPLTGLDTERVRPDVPVAAQVAWELLRADRAEARGDALRRVVADSERLVNVGWEAVNASSGDLDLSQVRAVLHAAADDLDRAGDEPDGTGDVVIRQDGTGHCPGLHCGGCSR